MQSALRIVLITSSWKKKSTIRWSLQFAAYAVCHWLAVCYSLPIRKWSWDKTCVVAGIFCLTGFCCGYTWILYRVSLVNDDVFLSAYMMNKVQPPDYSDIQIDGNRMRWWEVCGASRPEVLQQSSSEVRLVVVTKKTSELCIDDNFNPLSLFEDVTYSLFLILD